MTDHDDALMPHNSSFDEAKPTEGMKAAYSKVLRSISASEQSTEKLKKKLVLAGFSDNEIEYALNKAVEIGAVDNRRYSECLIRMTIFQGKGLSGALKEIQSLGVDPYSLESYEEYLELGENADFERALEYLENHPPRAKNIRDSAFRKLFSKGYSVDVCTRAAKSFTEKVNNYNNV